MHRKNTHSEANNWGGLTQDLHFDVPRLLDELLHKQGSVPESRQGLGVGPLVVLLQLLAEEEKNPYVSELEEILNKSHKGRG